MFPMMVCEIMVECSDFYKLCRDMENSRLWRECGGQLVKCGIKQRINEALLCRNCVIYVRGPGPSNIVASSKLFVDSYKMELSGYRARCNQSCAYSQLDTIAPIDTRGLILLGFAIALSALPLLVDARKWGQ